MYVTHADMFFLLSKTLSKCLTREHDHICQTRGFHVSQCNSFMKKFTGGNGTAVGYLNVNQVGVRSPVVVAGYLPLGSRLNHENT